MKSIRLLFVINLVTSFCASELIAQSAFKEGMVLYRADTLDKLKPNPKGFYVSQMKIYKKGDFIRQEVIQVNRFNSADTLRVTQIRNAIGIYMCLEVNSMPERMAVLTSYKEEKADRADRASKGYLDTYTIQKTGYKTRLSGLQAERVLIKGSKDTTSTEVLISTAIEMPVGLFFERMRDLKGLPLQFLDTENESDWVTRYTATVIKSRKLDPKLFEVDPKFTVMSMKQMEEMSAPEK